jgi:hypothetical protein
LLIASGYSPAETATKLGLPVSEVNLRIAELKDELERLAGLESTVRHCTQCGQVTLQQMRGMCLLCARGRPCCVCGTVEVLHLSLCSVCYPTHVHGCVSCGRPTRIRSSGLCSRCAREAQEARRVVATDQ